jgi:hypothetical protein
MTDTHGGGTWPSGEPDAPGSHAAAQPPAPAMPRAPVPPAYQPPYQQPYPQAYPPYQQPHAQPYGQVYGVPPAGAAPPGHYPYGQQPYGPYAPHLYAQPGYGPPGYGMRDPDKRPGTVLAAGIVALVLSGLTLLFAGVMLVALVAASSEFIDGFADGAALGTTDEDGLFAGILIVLAVMVLWCTAAIVLAILALRRFNWARITLVVSSGVTVAVSALAITGGVSVITLLGAVAVIVLLFTGGAGEWYRGRHDVDPTLPTY